MDYFKRMKTVSSILAIYFVFLIAHPLITEVYSYSNDDCSEMVCCKDKNSGQMNGCCSSSNCNPLQCMCCHGFISKALPTVRDVDPEKATFYPFNQALFNNFISSCWHPPEING